MKAFSKAICLTIALILLSSPALAIAEHIKQETVERFKISPLMSSTQFNASDGYMPGNGSADSRSLLQIAQLSEPYPGLLSYPSAPANHAQNLTPSNNDAIFQNGYQEGYQAGYRQGIMDACLWMISQIQGYMAENPLEGPKIKQPLDIQPFEEMTPQ